MRPLRRGYAPAEPIGQEAACFPVDTIPYSLELTVRKRKIASTGRALAAAFRMHFSEGNSEAIL